jgi:5'-nucleotidase
MNRRSFVRNIIAGGTCVYFGTVPSEIFSRDELVTLTILHTNDLHYHIEPFSGSSDRFNGKGGIARISEYAKTCRNENPATLLFDAGDMFQGTPYFNFFRGDLIFEVMTTAGYDAGTIGNHEFDNGLSGIAEALPAAGFPILSSNYDFTGTVLAGKFHPWKIFRKSGLKIGVYALGIELKGLVADKNFGNTKYIDPVKTALEMEEFLKKEKNCDLVICLSHLGLKYQDEKVSDMVLAGQTAFTDLIIGGHTHTFLEKPVVTKNKSGNQVIVNQASWGGLVIGRIDFVFEKDRKNKKTIFANKING